MVHRHTGDARACALLQTRIFLFLLLIEKTMGRIDTITENKIKAAANIVDVIGDFITLRKRGVEYQGLCPFHADHTLGSFSVSPAKQCYKCFSCGAGGDAIKFLMDYRDTRLTYGDALRYLAKKYSIWIDDDGEDERWKHVKPAKPKEIIEQKKEMLVMSRDVVLQTMRLPQRNIFIDWFCHLPWSDYPTNNQRQRLQRILWEYCVGRWTDGRVVFWQIDEQGRPRGGKLMRYANNGKRMKDENPGWMHNQAGIREHCDLEHHSYQSTLFGMHLLKRYPDATVNIVESEKTALICANAYGDTERNLWMACGGLKFLKIESLQPLIEQGRRVWLWPDKDGVDEWKEKVGHLLNERISITTRFLDEWWTEQDGPKADMADIILRNMTQQRAVIREKKEEKEEITLPDELAQHEAIMKAIEEWQLTHVPDEPFIDPVELVEPEVAEWREKIRNGKHGRTEQP